MTPYLTLQSAIYALLHRYTAGQDLVIGSTVSRRDHPALARQIGCYIDTIVLRGRAAGSDTAPELLRGETCDGRADVYSATVVAYELIAGTTPFVVHSMRQAARLYDEASS